MVKTVQSASMMRGVAVCALPIVMVVGLLTRPAAAEAPSVPAPAPAQTTVMERVVPLPFDTVWERMMLALQTLKPPGDLLQSGNLFEHPHGNAKLDKANGKIATPTFRYFKIFSAGFPPTERDYRDSYLLSLRSLESSPTATTPPSTAVRIQRKFEVYDTVKGNWTDGNPATEHVGIPVEGLFAALDDQLAVIPAPATPEGTTGALQSEAQAPKPDNR